MRKFHEYELFVAIKVHFEKIVKRIRQPHHSFHPSAAHNESNSRFVSSDTDPASCRLYRTA